MTKMNNIFTKACLQAVTSAPAEEGGKVFMISTILKVGGFCLVIMALIYVLAIFTPKIAEKVDKIIEKNKSKKNGYRTDEVRGIYDLPPAAYKKTSDFTDKDADSDKVNDERGQC